MADWRNRITGYTEEDTETLLANPQNWRIHPRTQMSALEGVLDAVGQVAPLVQNDRTGYLVDGHARAKLALERGQRRMGVIHIDVSPDEEATVIATLDPIGAMAVADREKFAPLVRQLQEHDAEMMRQLATQIATQYELAPLPDFDPSPLGEGQTDEAVNVGQPITLFVGNPAYRPNALAALVRLSDEHPEWEATLSDAGGH